jgi:hypothetical protein
MKRFILAALCGLFLVAAGEQKAQAWGCCGNGQHAFCFNFCGGGIGIWGKNSMYYSCDGPCGCHFPTLGPWYQYWPYAAHFQTPAPTGYGYWPSPMSAGAAGDFSSGGGHYPHYWTGH